MQNFTILGQAVLEISEGIDRLRIQSFINLGQAVLKI